MAREWGFESGGNLKPRTMDETLIEVFGCVSLNSAIIRLDTSKNRMRGATDLAMRQGEMDATLIEIFGCVSFDGVVRLDAGREKRRDRAGIKDLEAEPVSGRSLRVRYH